MFFITVVFMALFVFTPLARDVDPVRLSITAYDIGRCHMLSQPCVVNAHTATGCQGGHQ
jgi:hypothetical protein